MTQFGARSTMTSPAAQRINAAGRLAQWEMNRAAREAIRQAAEDLERARMERDAARDERRAALLRLEAERLRSSSPEPGLLPSPPSVRMIMDAVCEHFGVSRRDLLSARRTRTIVRPRQVVAFLGKELTNRSLPELGRLLGGRDHTTVIHAVRKVGELIAAGDPIGEDVAAIRAALR